MHAGNVSPLCHCQMEFTTNQWNCHWIHNATVWHFKFSTAEWHELNINDQNFRDRSRTCFFFQYSIGFEFFSIGGFFFFFLSHCYSVIGLSTGPTGAERLCHLSAVAGSPWPLFHHTCHDRAWIALGSPRMSCSSSLVPFCMWISRILRGIHWMGGRCSYPDKPVTNNSFHGEKWVLELLGIRLGRKF